MNESIIDPFHKSLHAVLVDDIDKRMVSLAEGSAATFDAYQYQTGYIQALNAVVAKCLELEHERYGARPGADEQQQA